MPAADRLSAERRLGFGLGLLAEGDSEGALDSVSTALQADPDFTAAWFTLAEAAEQAGQTAAAVEAYRRYRAQDPSDRLGAVARLVRLGAEDSPPTLPEAYLRGLFDQYAPRFDQSLRARLGYRGPELLAAALARVAGEERRWRGALDLGCGTGLMAVALAGRVHQLDGVDLAPAMVARASARGLYRQLDTGEATAALASRAGRGETLDLIVAADLLPYLGDLTALLRGVAALLLPGGSFAATLERANDAEGYRLQPTQRYAHGRLYLLDRLADAGLALALLEPDWSRREAGREVPGWVMVAQRL